MIRRILLICGSLVSLLLISITTLPIFLSTAPGKALLLSFVNAGSSQKLSIQTLSLNWTAPQRIEKIVIQEGDQITLSCDAIQMDRSLLKTIFTGNFGEIKILSPHANLLPTQKSTRPSKKSLFPLLFKGTLVVDQGELTSKEASLHKVHLELALLGSFNYALLLTGSTEHDNLEGQFDIRCEKKEKFYTAQLLLNQLPVSILDQILALRNPSLQGSLIEGIGSTLNGKLYAQGSTEKIELTALITSPHLSLQIQTEMQKEGMALKRPAELRFAPSPEFLALLPLGLPDSAIGKAPEFQIQLQHAIVPLQSGRPLWEDLSFQGVVKSRGVLFDDVQFDVSSKRLQDDLSFHCQAHAADGDFNLEAILKDGEELKAKTIVKQFPLDRIFPEAVEIFGQTVSFNTEAELEVGEKIALQAPLNIPFSSPKMEGNLELNNLNIPTKWQDLTSQGTLVCLVKKNKFVNQLTCPFQFETVKNIQIGLNESHFTTALLLSLDPKTTVLSNKKPILIDYTPDSTLLTTLIPDTTITSGLIQCQIQNLQVPLKEMDLVRVKGEVKTDHLLAIYQGKQALFQNPRLKFETAGKNQPTNCSFETKTQDGNIALSAKINRNRDYELHADIKSIQPQLLEAWFSSNKSWAPLIGSSINVKYDAHKKGDDEGLSLNIHSSTIETTLSFGIHEKTLELKSPAVAHLELTPQGYQLLNYFLKTNKNEKATPFELTKGSQIDLKLKSLKLPIDSPSFDTIQTDGVLKIASLAFEEKGQKTGSELKDFSATFVKDKNLTTLELLGSLVPTLSHPKPGSLRASIRFGRALPYDVNIEMKQCPALLIDLFTQPFRKNHYPFSTLLGKSFNLSCFAKIENQSGPIQVNLTSPQLRASFSGKLSAGNLLLKEPLFAQMNLTEQSSKLLLSDVNPLGISSFRSERPITLNIDPEGFSFPFTSFNINQCHIPRARIELGKIECHNEGNLSLTMGLLRSTNLTNKGNLKLWFAPIDVSIESGIATIERTEVLIANKLDVALWGEMDLLKNRVDMILGLTASCLKEAFGIKNLPKQYVLQLPLTGPIDNVKLNTKKATLKITALLAWQQKALAGALGGGSVGALFGELIDKFSLLPDSNAKTPRAKHPFPWEEEREGAQAESSSLKKRAIKKEDKPVKQLMKVLR